MQRFIKVDAATGRREIRLCQARPGIEWVAVPAAYRNQIVNHPERFDVRPYERPMRPLANGSQAPTHELVVRYPVRLHMSVSVIEADGVDTAHFQVTTDDPEAKRALKSGVRLLVNGQPFEAELATPEPIRSSRVGTFRVELADRRVYDAEGDRRATGAGVRFLQAVAVGTKPPRDPVDPTPLPMPPRFVR